MLLTVQMAIKLCCAMFCSSKARALNFGLYFARDRMDDVSLVMHQVLAGICVLDRKKPGTRPGEVQQGGESDERVSIIAFALTDRAQFLTNQENLADLFARPLCNSCMAAGF